MAETESNEKPIPPRSRASFSISGLISAAGSLVCLFTVTGFAGGWFWLFGLTSHFRVQYAAILLSFSAGFFCIKRWRAGATFLVFGLLNGWLLLPFLSSTDSPPMTTKPVIKLLAWNVNSRNQQFHELFRLLDREKPDLVLLMEVNSRWERFLETSITNYPHQQIAARDDNFGIALLSKRPLIDVRTLYLGEAGVPSVQAQFSIPGRTVSFLGTHPLPPVGSLRSRLRNEQLNAVATWVDQQTNAVVVVGDLNATPWSPVFQDFISATRLTNSAEGRGLHGTWPAFFKPMLIPIDHFLHSGYLTVLRREIVPAKGSDHLPQVVEFTSTIE